MHAETHDIDVDFEHERREIVMQWVFDTYGRDHAALCSTVIRYRTKGALRDVGKALGLPEDLIGTLSSQVWAWSEEGVEKRHVEELNLNLADRRLRLALDLARQLHGTPRHLSQHPGGFVLTHDRLDDLVPIEPAAMADRQVIEWDKDDIDALKFMKVDVLALGMLTCMKRGLDMLAAHKGIALDLASIPAEDPRTYAMIRKADTLGTFQIESRAQMSMLPRLKPRTYYDLVVQVAIVRPGRQTHRRMEDGLDAMQHQRLFGPVCRRHDRLHPQQLFAMGGAQQVDEHLQRHRLDRLVMDDREGADIAAMTGHVMMVMTVVAMRMIVVVVVTVCMC